MTLPYMGERPPPENDNARVEAGTGAETEQLGPLNPSLPLEIQQGLSHTQLARIADHRRSKPTEALPSRFQKELGRSWCEFARGRRC